MAIGIICRHCGARLKVPEKAAGKLGKCPGCKEVIRVPKSAAPEAHFCDRCEKSLAEEANIHLVTGKIYCGQCFNKMQGKKKTGDPVLDQLDINIPGMVVLRGKDQRDMGRMLKDVSAKKKFKGKTGEVARAPSGAAEKTKVRAAPSLSDDEGEFFGETSEETGAGAPVVETPEPEVPAPAAPEPEAPEPEAPEVEVEEAEAEAPAEISDELIKKQRPSDSELIKLLLDASVVLEGELELALQYQKGLGKRLIPVLDDLKLTSGDEIARVISEKTGLELCPDGQLEIADDVFSLMDDETLHRYEVVPLNRDGDSTVVAFPNPLDEAAIKDLSELLGTRIIPRVCTWTQYTGARRFLKSQQ